MNNRLAYFEKGTPVNAVNAGKALTIAGVVIDGETVTINNPAKAGSDVYEFLADTALSKTTVTNKAVDINSHVTKASGTLTIDTQPTATDTMTIGGKLYTFIANDAVRSNGKIRVGADLAGAKLAIVAAINGTDTFNTPNPKVSASAFASAICTLTALVGGVAGNAVATVETFTAGTNVFGAATLGSGADCSAANAATALIAAITASDTQGVGAVTGGSGVVTLSADVAGIDGNSISLAKAMANATFAGSATHLSGGVDGTESPLGTFMVDNTYLYVALGTNSNGSKNWRKIALSSL